MGHPEPILAVQIGSTGPDWHCPAGRLRYGGAVNRQQQLPVVSFQLPVKAGSSCACCFLLATDNWKLLLEPQLAS
jgi:hypothetical protein